MDDQYDDVTPTNDENRDYQESSSDDRDNEQPSSEDRDNEQSSSEDRDYEESSSDDRDYEPSSFEEEIKRKPDIIKVSARSRSTAVAGAIAGVMREYRYAEVQAIGAGAVNQAVKALAIARGYLTRDEIDIMFVVVFTEVDIDGQERTAIRFTVEPRPE